MSTFPPHPPPEIDNGQTTSSNLEYVEDLLRDTDEAESDLSNRGERASDIFNFTKENAGKKVITSKAKKTLFRKNNYKFIFKNNYLVFFYILRILEFNNLKTNLNII